MESFNPKHADIFNQLKEQIDKAIAYLYAAAKSPKSADLAECRYYLRVTAISAEYLAGFIKLNFNATRQRNAVLSDLENISEYVYNRIETNDLSNLTDTVKKIETAFDDIIATGKLASLSSTDNVSKSTTTDIREIANIFRRFGGRGSVPSDRFTFSAKTQLDKNDALSTVTITLWKKDRKREIAFYTCDAHVDVVTPEGKRYSLGAELHVHAGHGSEVGGAGIVSRGKFHSLRMDDETRRKLDAFFELRTPKKESTMREKMLTEIDLDLPSYDFGLSPEQVGSQVDGKRSLGIVAQPVEMRAKKEIVSAKYGYKIPANTLINVYFSREHPHHFFFFVDGKWQHALITRGSMYFSKFTSVPSDADLENYQKTGVATSVIGTSVETWGVGPSDDPSWNIALSFRDSSVVTECSSPLQKLIRECLLEILGGDTLSAMGALSNNNNNEEAPVASEDPAQAKRIAELDAKLSVKKEELAKVEAKVSDATKTLVAKANTLKVEIGKLTKDLENLKNKTQHGN